MNNSNTIEGSVQNIYIYKKIVLVILFSDSITDSITSTIGNTIKIINNKIILIQIA